MTEKNQQDNAGEEPCILDGMLMLISCRNEGDGTSDNIKADPYIGIYGILISRRYVV